MVLQASRIRLIAERYALLVAFFLLIGFFGMLEPNRFLTWANFSTVLGSQAVLVVLTLALLIPLVSDEFDLSTASVLSLSSMIIAVLNANLGIPVGWPILVAISTGLLVGLINGFFIVKVGIHSLIVTLGTGTFLNGVILWISDSKTISGISPSLVKYVVVYRLFRIPLEFYYGLVLCILTWYIFEYTSIGRQLLFVGRSREVARLSGIAVARVRWGALIASGLMSSIAGIFYAGTTGSADPTSGLSYLLPAFAAAFFGSTSIIPGRFNAWGSLIAVYFLAFGISGLTIGGIETFVQNLFYGGSLILAVTLSQLVKTYRGKD